MSPRPLPGPRLGRLLALVPWVLAHPGVTIAELAQRFEVDEEELERDLELLPLCGLPPYTADRLIDVLVGEDGAVDIRLAEYFERPLRLSAAEAVALLAAGRALLAVPGSDPDGPLATALAKLEAVLGARGALAVDIAASPHVAELQAAVADREQLEIEYYSFSRDEMTTRVVDPLRVFFAFGSWYLAAFCHRADDERLFRVDRVRAIRRTGTHIAAPEPQNDELELGELVYRPRPGDLRVRLRLARGAAWVIESVPHDQVFELDDGSFEVVLPVSGPAFLDRLLLELGPAATVLDPPEIAASVADTAARILGRYGVTVS